MDTLTDLFSYVCGQGRCFLIDETPLPVCQRCFGLYAGAALTTVLAVLVPAWRRGWPGTGVIVLHIVLLLTALAGGLHVVDPGPAWRMLCGLFLGHVGLLWLLAATAELRALRTRQRTLDWPRWATLVAYAMPVLLAAAAWAFAGLAHAGWAIWAGVAVCGAAAIAGAILNASVTAMTTAVHTVMRQRPAKL